MGVEAEVAAAVVAELVVVVVADAVGLVGVAVGLVVAVVGLVVAEEQGFELTAAAVVVEP